MKKFTPKLYLGIVTLCVCFLFSNCDGFMIQHINPPEGYAYYLFPSTKKENNYLNYLKSYGH